MLKSKTFVKKTRKGGVMKIVREHYLRDDVLCGVTNCSQCAQSEPTLEVLPESNSSLFDFPHFIVPDTNIALHQIDFLEDTGIRNVILLQTVLQEVKHLNASVHKRIRDIISLPKKCFYVFSNEHCKLSTGHLVEKPCKGASLHLFSEMHLALVLESAKLALSRRCTAHAIKPGDTYIEREKDESANDRNDRAIRVACRWYNKHIEENYTGENPNHRTRIVLLTNDAGNREKALIENLQSCSAFVQFCNGSKTHYPVDSAIHLLYNCQPAPGN